jgi:thymidine phosphorylase
MNALINAQGTRLRSQPPAAGALSLEVCAARWRGGRHRQPANRRIARLRRAQGTRLGRGLLCKLGDPAQAGQALYRIHAAYASDLEFARQASAKSSGYAVGDAQQMSHVFVEF